MKLKLIRTLSSADAQPEQEIPFEVVDDIDVAGATVIRRGAQALGVVTAAKPSKRMGRAGNLAFEIRHVLLADGQKATVRSFSSAAGESRGKGIGAAAIALPAVGAVLLFMKGGDYSLPAGTQITAFIDGDKRVHVAKDAGH